MMISRKLRCYVATAVLAVSAQSLAGAFQLWEQSAASLGNYHAGGAAEANDASATFYNPAGMSRINHQQISFGAAAIALGTRFDGVVYLGGSPAGATTSAVPGDTFNIVPNFHYVLPINDHWRVGLEETTPFGLSTNYVDFNSSNVQYLATKTELKTFNLNPSVSYLINRYVSLGVGFDALYGEATYDSFPFGLSLNNKLRGWGYGYNAGLLLQFTPQTRAGVSYRSAITIDADGHSKSATFLGGMLNSSISARFPLPATTTMSVYHDVNHRWAVMATAFYTQWSCFRTLVIKNMATALGSTATVAINENFRNSWNFSVGTRYKINRHFSVQAGFGHDETPTRLPYRDIRLPGGNRYAASIGLDIRPRPNFKWSMGWTHFFIGSTPVNNSGGYNNQSTILSSQIPYGIGIIHPDVNVFGMQLTWNV